MDEKISFLKDSSIPYCNNCGYQLRYQRAYRQTQGYYYGKSISFTEEYATCVICGQEVYVEDIYESNRIQAKQIYEKFYGKV